MAHGPFPRTVRLGGLLVHRVPAAPLLADEAVLLQAGKHPVKVVLLDAHLLCNLRDGDSGIALDELQRLLAARPRAARAATATVARSVRRGSTGGGSGTTRAGGGQRGIAADAVERGDRRFQAVELVHQ